MTELLARLTAALTDRYSVERELGRGGMATVYLARDLRHRRPVALKVLHPELAYAVGADRFLREIEVAANLTHPHILPLHDSGEVAGLLYYVMPYVEGESLRDRLDRETQLPVDEALQIAREVADALAYAHGQGVIHRDIKPGNILLSGGHALVADFGIARALGQAGDERLTETGTAVGTAAYMSPEQASGERQLDGRSDVYSLGCVLYEMLAGEPPYTGPTAQAIIAKRFSEPVPRVRHVRPSVPESVEHAVTRALAPVAADRFASAAEFARALQPTVAGPTTTPTVPVAAAVRAGSRRSAAPDGRARRRMPVAATALGLGFLIGLGVLFAWRRSHHEGDSSGGGLKRLAVLPFENLGDSASEYFADGVADAVRGKLASLPGLQVIASASASQYKRSTKAPQEIARELGVDYLLVGKIRWARDPGGASRVQVSPELMRVAPGAAPTTTWQQPFDAALTDVFQVQADIARRVAEALGVALGVPEQLGLAERPTRSLTAYDWYLKGLYFWNKRTRAGLEEAAAYFQRAIAADSGYARAYAGLADSYTLLGTYGYLAPQEAYARAKAAALRALRLDERLAEAHASLANVRQWERDWRGAEAEYRRAIELNPNYASAHQWYGELLPDLGQLNKALAEDRRAEALDPLSPVISVSVGSTLYYQRRYDAALAQLRKAVLLDSTFSVAHEVLGSVYLQQRRPEEARAALHRAVELSSAPAFIAELAYAQAAFGARDSALLILHELRERALREYVSPGTLALVYTGLGDKDQAFTWLDRGVSAHEAWYYDWADPLWDPLRADPRFTEHLKKLGLR